MLRKHLVNILMDLYRPPETTFAISHSHSLVLYIHSPARDMVLKGFRLCKGNADPRQGFTSRDGPCDLDEVARLSVHGHMVVFYANPSVWE